MNGNPHHATVREPANRNLKLLACEHALQIRDIDLGKVILEAIVGPAETIF